MLVFNLSLPHLVDLLIFLVKESLGLFYYWTRILPTKKMAVNKCVDSHV